MNRACVVLSIKVEGNHLYVQHDDSLTGWNNHNIYLLMGQLHSQSKYRVGILICLYFCLQLQLLISYLLLAWRLPIPE